MITAEDFIAQHTPRSALEPFHDEIAKLRAAKMSYQKIQAFLKLNGINTHVNNVRGYCQRHIEKDASAQKALKKPSKAKAKTDTTSKKDRKAASTRKKTGTTKKTVKKEVATTKKTTTDDLQASLF